ncbi:predicted protein [Nematostella vectensis]|uniref:Uncharacterized protein n=1 Tax=Nematostella vectensis TaxID=45351 RepID=A7S6V9_NEMVE|nr:predicted protein [Nematostella vectensis]|eukprot:XP_001632593.1 predicted protein [Nematostella vectensis]
MGGQSSAIPSQASQKKKIWHVVVGGGLFSLHGCCHALQRPSERTIYLSSLSLYDPLFILPVCWENVASRQLVYTLHLEDYWLIKVKLFNFHTVANNYCDCPPAGKVTPGGVLYIGEQREWVAPEPCRLFIEYFLCWEILTLAGKVTPGGVLYIGEQREWVAPEPCRLFIEYFLCWEILTLAGKVTPGGVLYIGEQREWVVPEPCRLFIEYFLCWEILTLAGKVTPGGVLYIGEQGEWVAPEPCRLFIEYFLGWEILTLAGKVTPGGVLYIGEQREWVAPEPCRLFIEYFLCWEILTLEQKQTRHNLQRITHLFSYLYHKTREDQMKKRFFSL